MLNRAFDMTQHVHKASPRAATPVACAMGLHIQVRVCVEVHATCVTPPQQLEAPLHVGLPATVYCHQLDMCVSLRPAADEAFMKGDVRTQKDLDGLGCLGDIGWYCLSVTLWAFNHDPPSKVQAQIGVPCISLLLVPIAS